MKKLTPKNVSGKVNNVSRKSAQKKYTPKVYNKTPKSADYKMPMVEQQKLIGLGLGKDFEMNDKTPGYFKSQEIDDRVNELSEEFSTLE